MCRHQEGGVEACSKEGGLTLGTVHQQGPTGAGAAGRGPRHKSGSVAGLSRLRGRAVACVLSTGNVCPLGLLGLPGTSGARSLAVLSHKWGQPGQTV